MTTTTQDQLEGLGTYKFGWADSDVAGASARRGLSEEVVRDISARKNEPEWMLKLRLQGLRNFGRKPMPSWGADLSGIDFDNIKYFVRSTEKQAASWDELPADIKSTYDRLGNDPHVGRRLVELLANAGLEPRRIALPLFGACAGEASFPAYVANLAGVLSGARDAILDTGGVSREGFEAALDSIRVWGERRDATFWFTISWAEAVKP